MKYIYRILSPWCLIFLDISTNLVYIYQDTLWFIFTSCVDVLEDISSFFLTCCNAIMKFAWAGWKMPVLCGNQIKGRKIRFVQAVFCNSKLTLQLSFAPDCSNEYFLEVALKARQSWVLHKTFAAAGGRTDNIQKISRRRGRECICWISKCTFVDYNMCLSKLKNIFV